MLESYSVKTCRKVNDSGKEKKYIILERTYYSQTEKKYVVADSMFITPDFATELINLGVRLFDNGNLFEKV